MKDKKNVLNGVKTVVFDLDGTLYNKSGLARRMVTTLWWCLPLLAAERLARRNMHYVHFASEEEFYRVFFRTMSRGHWWGPLIASTWYCDIYLPTMVRLIKKYQKPRPETLELIAECKRRGLQMAIYSDYTGVPEKLEALGIDASQFEVLTSAPMFGALKPSPICAHRVLELLQADPLTTLFVGDREDKDGATARAVGAKFYLITDNDD